MLKEFTGNFNPLKILTEEQVKAIQRGVIAVLERTGVKFENEKALKLFADNGCKVDFNTHVVRFPPGLVEECLHKAPSNYLLKSRDPKDDMIVGGDTIYFMASIGMRAADSNTEERYKPTLRESIDGVKVSY